MPKSMPDLPGNRAATSPGWVAAGCGIVVARPAAVWTSSAAHRAVSRAAGGTSWASGTQRAAAAWSIAPAGLPSMISSTAPGPTSACPLPPPPPPPVPPPVPSPPPCFLQPAPATATQATRTIERRLMAAGYQKSRWTCSSSPSPQSVPSSALTVCVTSSAPWTAPAVASTAVKVSVKLPVGTASSPAL